MKTALDHVLESKRPEFPLVLGHIPSGVEDPPMLNPKGFPIQQEDFARHLKNAVVFQVEEDSWTPTDTKEAQKELTGWLDHWEEKVKDGHDEAETGNFELKVLDVDLEKPSVDRESHVFIHPVDLTTHHAEKSTVAVPQTTNLHHMNFPNCRLPYDNMVLMMKASGALTEDLIHGFDIGAGTKVDTSGESLAGGKDIAVWLLKRPQVKEEGWLSYSLYILGTGQGQLLDRITAPVNLFGTVGNARSLTPALEDTPIFLLRLCSQIVCDFYLEAETHNLYFEEVYLKIPGDEVNGDTGVIGVDHVIKQVFIGILCRALKVCAVINCKNVGVETVHPSSRSQRSRRKKKKPPLVSYKTLVIKNASTNKSGGNGQGTGTNRLHLCRGHFKTYTEDSPLMGRHVGTYWWQPMARGKSREGQVIKDYSVQKTQEELA